MNVQFKKVGTWIGLAALSASITISLSGCPASLLNNTQKKEVKIDTNLPLSGELAVYGTSVRNGANFAVEDLEKSDPDSPKLNFSWEDNAGSPSTAVSIFQKQYLDPPDIYVSGVKPQTDAIQEQVNSKGTPYFVWIFDAFINKNSNNQFRTWLNFKIESPMYLKFVTSHKAKRVAIVYVKLPNTEEQFNKLVIPELKKQGIQVFVEDYAIGLNDFKNLAVKVQQFKPDVIILNGFQNNLVGIVRAFRPLGLITQNNTIGSFDMLDAAIVLGKDEIEGISVTAPFFVLYPENPKIAEWSKRFKEKYNQSPLYTDAFAYDMTSIIHDAAKRLTLPATSEQWIQTLRETNITGITGPLKFDEQGDLITPLEIGIYHNGKLIPLSPPKTSNTPPKTSNTPPKTSNTPPKTSNTPPKTSNTTNP